MTLYSQDAHSLVFVNSLSENQWTSKGRATNGLSLLSTSKRQLIMAELVLQVWKLEKLTKKKGMSITLHLTIKSGFIGQYKKTTLKIVF